MRRVTPRTERYEEGHNARPAFPLEGHDVEEDRLRETVRRAARGEEDAAGDLFDTYYPRVYRYALARLADRSDAEDVAAETFARVLRGLDRFRWRGAGFEAWLFRIASNLVVDHARKGRRESPRAAVVDEVRAEASAEESALQRVDRRAMDQLLDRLSPDQREVLLLRFAAGLDSKEVGRVMKRNENAVRQLQFRALGNLRRLLEEGPS
jgi:RNA polymerase sigma-70 factor, ECF subfamily